MVDSRPVSGTTAYGRPARRAAGRSPPGRAGRRVRLPRRVRPRRRASRRRPRVELVDAEGAQRRRDLVSRDGWGRPRPRRAASTPPRSANALRAAWANLDHLVGQHRVHVGPSQQRLRHDHALHLDGARRDRGGLGVAPVVVDGAVQRCVGPGLESAVPIAWNSTSATAWSHWVTAMRAAEATVGSRSPVAWAARCGRPAGGPPAPAPAPGPTAPAARAGRSSQRGRQLGAERAEQALAPGVAGDADPLEGQRLLDDRPPLVDGAEHVGLGRPARRRRRPR